MSAALASRDTGRAGTHPLFLPLALAGAVLLAAGFTLAGARDLLPPRLWWQAATAPDGAVAEELLFHFAFLPRLAVGLLAGAALGLSGTLFQQVLRNPLAEPTTLGTSAGAGLALALAGLYAPGLLDHGRGPIALAGAVLATLAVLAVAGRRHFSPVALILAGLVATLVAGSASALLVLAKRDYLTDLFIWQSGSLVQNGWAPTVTLALWLALCIPAAFLLVRPLAAAALGDDAMRALGLPPVIVRLAVLAVAVGLGAAVAASIGVIGFIGIAAPAIARRAGARKLKAQMIAAPLIGALLVWLADQSVQHLGFAGEVPAGTATALIGAPLLLFLLPSLRHGIEESAAAPSSQRRCGMAGLALLALLLMALLAAALCLGRDAAGWGWTGADLLPLRLPRVTVALTAGVMLGMAGAALQRVTGNPMAAPEVLGVAPGAALGVMVLMLAAPGIERLPMLLAAAVGAGLALLALFLVSRREPASGERLLLAGVAIATGASALEALVLAGGDLRLDFLVAWMSGSTYRATMADAGLALAGMAATLLLLPAAARSLEILPLGPVARALGLDPRRERVKLVALIVLPVAAATLVMGPLSFVGLVGPHMARLIGFRRALPHLLASGLLGGAVLMAADWCGRVLFFPWQLPAGLIAAFIGGPYFLWLMWRTR
ncbi:MAG: transport system permease [Xanthobacteraceae bacterium]|jgi:iron complex transport system permease protein|nr:transport system permease [Xanthobacteraceae bacterium]